MISLRVPWVSFVTVDVPTDVYSYSRTARMTLSSPAQQSINNTDTRYLYSGCTSLVRQLKIHRINRRVRPYRVVIFNALAQYNLPFRSAREEKKINEFALNANANVVAPSRFLVWHNAWNPLPSKRRDANNRQWQRVSATSEIDRATYPMTRDPRSTRSSSRFVEEPSCEASRATKRHSHTVGKFASNNPDDRARESRLAKWCVVEQRSFQLHFSNHVVVPASPLIHSA